MNTSGKKCNQKKRRALFYRNISFKGPNQRGGKLGVLGAGLMFADQYIDKEDNDRLRDIIFRYLTSDDVHLNAMDAEDPEVSMLLLAKISGLSL